MGILSLNFKNQTIDFEALPSGQLAVIPKTEGFEVPAEKKHLFRAVEIQITGENPDVHHGAKRVLAGCGTVLIFKNFEEIKNEKKTEYIFTLENNLIRVKLHYEVFSGIDVLRGYTEVENITDSSLGLEYVSSLALTGLNLGIEGSAIEKIRVGTFYNTWCKELNYKENTLEELGFLPGGLARVSVSSSGTWSTKEHLAQGFLMNTESKKAYLWQIENNGSWNYEISEQQGFYYLRAAGPGESENNWWKNLEAGESFTSVKAAIAFGESFEDTVSEMTKYRREIINRPESDLHQPVIFNDYLHCLWANPTTEREIPVIDAAAKAGAEFYCMDAGWYADGVWWDTVGEWNVNEKRFPGGIKKLFSYIKEKGMTPGIWLEPEVIGIKCPALSKFNDEDFFMRHGKRVIDHGRYQFDFRSEFVRSYLTEKVDWLVSELGIGYFKFDYNIDAGIGTDYNASSPGDGLMQHGDAYLSWIDSLREKYPHLIIENCASGGLRMDYKSLSHTAVLSLTDANDYKTIGIIASASGTAVVPEQAAVWVAPIASYSDGEIISSFVNAMFKRIHLSGVLHLYKEAQAEIAKKGIDYYKSIREEIPSLIPYFPLGLTKYSDKILCAGYKGKDKIYMTLVNTEEEETLEIPVKGIKDAKIPFGEGSVISTENDKVKITLPEKSGAVLECIL